jgi:hypothetical protein
MEPDPVVRAQAPVVDRDRATRANPGLAVRARAVDVVLRRATAAEQVRDRAVARAKAPVVGPAHRAERRRRSCQEEIAQDRCEKDR